MEKLAVQVIMKVMPRSYAGAVNYYHGIVQHRFPFVDSFGTMMTQEKLRQFTRTISEHHGDSVSVTAEHGRDHTLVTLAYSPQHFNGEQAVLSLVEKARFLARCMNSQSRLVPPDHC